MRTFSWGGSGGKEEEEKLAYFSSPGDFIAARLRMSGDGGSGGQQMTCVNCNLLFVAIISPAATRHWPTVTPPNTTPLSASTSHHPVGSKSLKVMKQKQGGLSTNDNSGGTSILRQQLQGIPCSNKYRKAQETLCKDCGKPYTTKCLLQVCRKSDEVGFWIYF